MSSGQFNSRKGKAIAGGNPRRGRGGASGSVPNPIHTPSSNSIPSPNFGDYVPDDLTDEQIDEMFEASKSIHEGDEQEQPKKPKQRKPTELKSALFAIHYSKTDDVKSGPDNFLVKCNYCTKVYNGSLDLGTGSSSPVHIPSSSSSIASFGFAIPELGEWNDYQEELSRKRTRYQSNAYQELENYLTTFELGALERGPDGNNNLLKWWAKRSTIFSVVAIIAKEILVVPASTVSVEQAFSVGGYILDERRSRLTPQNLEAQALLNDWVKAELRQQEPNYNEQEDSDTYDTGSSNDSVDLGD
ncbi:hypothetical protein OROMI_002421 [Orobanche minor]